MGNRYGVPRFPYAYAAMGFMLIAPTILLCAFYIGAYYVAIPVAISVISVITVLGAVILAFWGARRILLGLICSLVFLVLMTHLIVTIRTDRTFKRDADLGLAILYHDVGLVQRRIAEGSDVNGKTPQGMTMLTCACCTWFHRGNAIFGDNYLREMRGKFVYTLLKLLLENGASQSVNVLDDYRIRQAPLHHVVGGYGYGTKNQKRIVQLLISYGADVNLKDGEGETSLHLAASYGCPLEIIELLLEKGADINAQNAESKTPLQLADENGNTVIADLLRKHGAKE